MKKCSLIRLVGKVRGKPRPRFSTVNGYPKAYTPKSAHQYEKQIATEYKHQNGVFCDGETAVRIDVFRAMPKSRPKKLLQEPDVFKPDVDNIAKSVLDALNGVAWKDDAQITELHVIKHPRTHRDTDVMHITVSEKEQQCVNQQQLSF